MPRRRRFASGGFVYHVLNRAVARDRIFQKPADYLAFEDVLEEAKDWVPVRLLDYCVMPEHAHLVVHPREHVYNIADIRKAIKSPVASRAIKFLEVEAPEWLPRITRRRGDKSERLFWQSGGGYDRNITEPKTLMQVIDYVHMNPVRRGLVDRAVQWKWSSAAWFLGAGTPPLIPDRILPEWVG